MPGQTTLSLAIDFLLVLGLLLRKEQFEFIPLDGLLEFQW
jgi:hypothetical protein